MTTAQVKFARIVTMNYELIDFSKLSILDRKELESLHSEIIRQTLGAEMSSLRRAAKRGFAVVDG